MAIPKLSGTKRKMHVDDNKDVSETETDVSESLSDIEDAEIAPYFNKKEEVFYKRVIWEAMNKDFGQGGSRKRARKPAKAAAPNKAVKASTEIDGGKKTSSKINYKVLNKLNEEDARNHTPDFEEDSHSDLQRSNDKLDNDEQSLGGSYDDELDNDNAYSEEAEGRQAYEDDENTCYPNEDYNEYGYDDEYGADEY